MSNGHEIGEMFIKIDGGLSALEGKLVDAERKAKKSGERAGSSFGDSFTDKVANSANKLGNILTVGLTAPLGLFAKSTFDAARKTEALDAALTQVTGSAAKAKAQKVELRKEADRLGVNYQSLIQSSLGLTAAFKGNVQESNYVLRNFNMVMGALKLSSEEQSRANTNLMQIASSTRLFGDELKEMNSIIPGFSQWVEKAFGTTSSEKLAKMGISGKQALQAIAWEMEHGGLKPNLDTASAKISEIENQWFDLKVAAGEALLPIAKDYLPKITAGLKDITKWYKDLDPDKKEGLWKWGVALAVGGPILKGLGATLAILKDIRLTMAAIEGINIAKGLAGAGAGAATGVGAATTAPLIAGAAAVGIGSYAAYRTFYGDLQDQKGNVAGKDTESALATGRDRAFQELKRSYASEFARTKDSKSAIANILGTSGIGGPFAGGKDEVKQILERIAWSLDPQNQVGKGGFAFGMQDYPKGGRKAGALPDPRFGDGGVNPFTKPGAVDPKELDLSKLKFRDPDTIKKLNRAMLEDLVKMADKFGPLFLSSGLNSHSAKTTSGNASRHKVGNAVDIWGIDGLKNGDKGFREKMFEMQRYLASMGAVKNSENGNDVATLFGYGRGKGPGGNHNDHMHYSNRGSRSILGGTSEFDDKHFDQKEKAKEEADKKAKDAADANADQWKKYTKELMLSTQSQRDWRNKWAGMLSQMFGGSLTDRISIEKFGRTFDTLNSPISRNEVQGEYLNRSEANRAKDAAWKKNSSMEYAREFFETWADNNRAGMDREKERAKSKARFFDYTQDWLKNKWKTNKQKNERNREIDDAYGGLTDRLTKEDDDAIKAYNFQLLKLDERMAAVSGSASVTSMRLKNLTTEFLAGRDGQEAYEDAAKKAQYVIEYEANVLQAERWKSIGDDLARSLIEPSKNAFKNFITGDLRSFGDDIGNMIDQIVMKIAASQFEMGLTTVLNSAITSGIGGFLRPSTRSSATVGGKTSGPNLGLISQTDARTANSNAQNVQINIHATDAASVIASKQQIAYELSSELDRARRMG